MPTKEEITAKEQHIIDTILVGVKGLHSDLLMLSETAKKNAHTDAYARGVTHAYKKSAQYLGHQIKLIEDLRSE